MALIRSILTTCLAVALWAGMASSARADDGCTVVLCLAGNWKQIDQCVPPVKKALRDLARGLGLPSCDMASAGDSGSAGARNQMLIGETCPPQYSYFIRNGDGQIVGRQCTVSGAITVAVDGLPWSVTYWNGSNSATWFSDQARQGLGAGDSQYDADLAVWQRSDAYVEWNCVMYGDCPAFDPSTPTGPGEGG